MKPDDLPFPMARLPGAVPAWRVDATADTLTSLAQTIAQRGGRIAALWGTDDRDRGAGFALHAAFVVEGALLWTEVPLPAERPEYPDLSATFSAANRMQRGVHDL